jgi:hypothetical protein
LYVPSKNTTILTDDRKSTLCIYAAHNSYALQQSFLYSRVCSVSSHLALPGFYKRLHRSLNLLPLKKKTNQFMAIKLHFRKFSFTGKGYRLICSKRNTITFNFGFSHMFYVYNIQIKPYHLSKTKLLFIGLNYFIMQSQTTQFFYVKPLNIFTWRGLRPLKKALRKKVGKVSLYF